MDSKDYRIPIKKKQLMELAHSYQKKQLSAKTKEEGEYWKHLLSRTQAEVEAIKPLEPGEEDSPYYSKEEILERIPKLLCAPEAKTAPGLTHLLSWALSVLPKYVVDYLVEHQVFLIPPKDAPEDEDAMREYLKPFIPEEGYLTCLDKNTLNIPERGVMVLHECAHGYLDHNLSPFSEEETEKQTWALVNEWLSPKCLECGNIQMLVEFPSYNHCEKCGAVLRKEATK